MIELVPSATKTIIDERVGNISVYFNGKIYNGKRYFACTYRTTQTTRSGAKKATMIWQDGLGWLDCVAVWENDIEEAFGLAEKEIPILNFGKYAGSKLSEVPTSYLKWLIIHKNVLKAENQSIAEDVKVFLA